MDTQKIIEKLDIAESRQVFISNPVGVEEAKDFQAVYNVSKGKISCIASKEYHIIQHRDVFQSVTEALQNLNIKHTEKVGCGRNSVFIDVEFPDSKLYVAVGETFYVGIRIINSYDKTTGLIICPRLVRLACKNGMVVDLKCFSGISMIHSDKLVVEFEKQIPIMIKSMVEGQEKFKAMVNNAIGDSVEWELCTQILKNLVGRKKHAEAILSLIPNNGNPVTRWDIYNAITSYTSHNQQLKPTLEMWLQNKAQKLLVKPLENFVSVEVE